MGQPDLTNYVSKEDASKYVASPELDKYALDTDLKNYAKTVDLQNYAKAVAADLQNYAKESTLQNYAKESTLQNYAKASDLTGFVSKGELSGFASKSDLADYALNADIESSYARFDHTHGNYVTNDQIVNYYTIEAANKKFQPIGNYAAFDHTHGNLYYTKTESDGKFQVKGNYQPAGSYALANHNHANLYQPIGNYQTAGNYTLQTSFATFQTAVNTSFGNSILCGPDGTLCQVPSRKGGLNLTGDQFIQMGTTRFNPTFGNLQLGVAGHAANSPNYSLELNAPNVPSIQETSIRFHQPNKYWKQIRADNTGFRFTEGDSGKLDSINAGTVNTGVMNITGNKINGVGASGPLDIDPNYTNASNSFVRVFDRLNVSGSFDTTGDATIGGNLCSKDLCLTQSDIISLKNMLYSVPAINLLNNDTWLNDNANIAGNTLVRVNDMTAASGYKFLWRFTRKIGDGANFYGAAQTINVSSVSPVGKTFRFGIWFKKTRSTNTNIGNVMALDITFLGSTNNVLKTKQILAPRYPQVDSTWRFVSIDDVAPTGTINIKVKISSHFDEHFDFLPNAYLTVL